MLHEKGETVEEQAEGVGDEGALEEEEAVERAEGEVIEDRESLERKKECGSRWIRSRSNRRRTSRSSKLGGKKKIRKMKSGRSCWNRRRSSRMRSRSRRRRSGKDSGTELLQQEIIKDRKSSRKKRN